MSETENLRESEPQQKKGGAGKVIRDFLLDVLICFAAVELLVNFVVRPVVVRGSSMYPTLEDGSYGFTNVMGRRLDDLERFDIVIIYLEEKDEYIVKRIVGLPGETISYKDGVLYVDGQAVEETFLDTAYVHSYEGTFMPDMEPVTLGEDEYFCLGDNRPHSSDSRIYGAFSSDRIIAKGIFIFYPFSQWGVRSW